MFGKLKEKLKGALSIFSKKAQEQAEEKIVEAPSKIVLPVKTKDILATQGKKAPEPPKAPEQKKVVEKKPEIKKTPEKKEMISQKRSEEKKEQKEPFIYTKQEPQRAPAILEKKPEKKEDHARIPEKKKEELLGKQKEQKKLTPNKEVLHQQKNIIAEKIHGVKITYFVHGTTTDNQKGISTGWHQGELSEQGKQQCLQLRSLISDQKFDVIFCSDLKRAVDSAKLIFPNDSYRIMPDRRLRECNYGALNGNDEKIVKKQIIARIDEPFPDGESYHDVEKRMLDFLEYVARSHTGKHIAIVAHQAPQLALDVLLKGKTWELAIQEDWRATRSWQPGWIYWLDKKLTLSKRPEKKKMVVENRGENRATTITSVDQAKEEPPTQPEEKEKKGFFSRLKETFAKKEEKAEEKTEGKREGKKEELGKAKSIGEEKGKTEETKEKKVHVAEVSELPPVSGRPPEEIIVPAQNVKVQAPEPEPVEERGFFGRIKQAITTKTISEEKFEELFWELELALLENNVSVEVIEKIKTDLKEELVNKPLPRDVESKIIETLKGSLQDILSFDTIDLPERILQKKSKPYIIAFFGINGSGKTTSIAKLTHYLQQHGLSVVLAACDTFRAAAIQQLEEHAHRLGVRMIKQNYGADAAAVAYDAVKFAEKNNSDVVLIDTAGRLHSNTNLMAELEKIIRVTKPDLKIFVGESITGNDCIEQAKQFNQLVNLDGTILTKADVDDKGGAPLSIAYTIKKPILFMGVGQRYEDFEKFDADVILERLGL